MCYGWVSCCKININTTLENIEDSWVEIDWIHCKKTKLGGETLLPSHFNTPSHPPCHSLIILFTATLSFLPLTSVPSFIFSPSLSTLLSCCRNKWSQCPLHVTPNEKCYFRYQYVHTVGCLLNLSMCYIKLFTFLSQGWRNWVYGAVFHSDPYVCNSSTILFNSSQPPRTWLDILANLTSVSWRAGVTRQGAHCGSRVCHLFIALA